MRTQTKKLLAIVCSGLMSVCCIFAGWLGLQKNTSVTAETVTGGELSSYYAAESTSFNVEDDETFGATLGAGAYIQDGASFRKATPILTSGWVHQKWEYNKLMKFGYTTWKDATANNNGIRCIQFGGTSPAASWKPNNYNSYLVRLDYETDKVELYNAWVPTLADGTTPGRVRGASLSLALEYGKEYFIEVGAIDLYATEDKSGEIVGDRLIVRIYDGETLLLEIKHDYTGTQVPTQRAQFFTVQNAFDNTTLGQSRISAVADVVYAKNNTLTEKPIESVTHFTQDGIPFTIEGKTPYGTFPFEGNTLYQFRFSMDDKGSSNEMYSFVFAGGGTWDSYALHINYKTGKIGYGSSVTNAEKNVYDFGLTYGEVYSLQIAAVSLYNSATPADGDLPVGERIIARIANADGTKSMDIDVCYVGDANRSGWANKYGEGSANPTRRIGSSFGLYVNQNDFKATLYPFDVTKTLYAQMADSELPVMDISETKKIDKEQSVTDQIQSVGAFVPYKLITMKVSAQQKASSNGKLIIAFGGGGLWNSYAICLNYNTGGIGIGNDPTSAETTLATLTSLKDGWGKEFTVQFGLMDLYDNEQLEGNRVGERLVAYVSDGTETVSLVNMYVGAEERCGFMSNESANPKGNYGLCFATYINAPADVGAVLKSVEYHTHISVDNETVIATPAEFAQGLAAKTQEGKVFVGYANGGKLYKAATAMDESLFVNDAAFTSVFVDYDMGYGAYLRSDCKGIRWEATINDADWNALLALDSTAKRGMGLQRLSDNAGTFIEAVSTYVKADGVTGFVCAVTDVADVSVEYEARAYIEVQYANVEGRSKVYAATNDNVRSILAMAQTALSQHEAASNVLPADVVEKLQSIVGGAQ